MTDQAKKVFTKYKKSRILKRDRVAKKPPKQQQQS